MRRSAFAGLVLVLALSATNSSPSMLTVFSNSGLIEVMDITLKTWRLLMRWQAHKGAILKLFLDTKSLWSVR